MPLSQGTRLGHYEIVTLLGKGGMGEVYRARDTKLDRDVAVKVLPADFAAHKDRLARFEREAKSLAALNHPNIATLFGFEEDDGTHFLVMELVEGEDLADRIRRGPLRVDETIPLFAQIADGLEAAHEKGIVHRDLKPANIKIASDGRVKILDFGLAKAMEPEASAVGTGDLSQSPTMTAAATMRGEILGTAAYMSPEQARGQVLDKRTDIWAYGACWFEALSGKAPFGGATVSDTLASILRDEPDWSGLPEHTHPWIELLLRRLLAKNPRQRLRDIGDARLELANDLPLTEVTTSHRALPAAVSWVAMWWLVVGGLVGATLTYFSISTPLGVSDGPTAHSAPLRYSIPLDDLRPGYLNDDGLVTVSPDGSTLALTAGVGPGARLFLKERASLGLEPVEGVAGAWYKSFSPDSQWLMYSSVGDEMLWRVPKAGGTPLRIVEGVEIFGHDWDGMSHAVYSTPFGLKRISFAGGEPETLTKTTPADGFLAHRFPQVLPGGSGILLTLASGSSAAESGIGVLDRDGTVRTLLKGGLYGRYAESGHLVYASGEALYAVAFDLNRLEINGEPRRVVDGLHLQVSYGLAPFSISRQGTLAYVPSSTDDALRTSLLWMDRQGRTEPLPFARGAYGYPRLSPDGQRLAVNDANHIFILDLLTNRPRQFTRQVSNAHPVWTPDGRKIIFMSDRDGVWDLYSKSVVGTDDVIRLTTQGPAGQELVPMSISSDGVLLVRRDSSGQGFDLGTMDLEKGATWEPLVVRAGYASNGAFSPDGRWVAYEVWEQGRPDVWVQPYPPTGERWQVSSAAGGRSAVWSKSSDELFYLESREAMMQVGYRVEDQTFRPASPQPLFQHPIYDVGNGTKLFDVSPDGERFLAIEAQDLSKGEVIVIENWFDELKQLVPAN